MRWNLHLIFESGTRGILSLSSRPKHLQMQLHTWCWVGLLWNNAYYFALLIMVRKWESVALVWIWCSSILKFLIARRSRLQWPTLTYSNFVHYPIYLLFSRIMHCMDTCKASLLKNICLFHPVYIIFFLHKFSNVSIFTWHVLLIDYSIFNIHIHNCIIQSFGS